MKWISYVIITLLVVAIGASQINTAMFSGAGQIFPATYYVSTSGNDSWSGLLAFHNAGNTDGPFLTLGKAQTTMRGGSLKTTYIHGGTYTFAANLVFSSSDNGETWHNYPSEIPVMDGSSNTYRILLGGVSNLTLWGITFQNMLGTCTAACGDVGAITGSSSNLKFQYNTFTNCSNGCLMGSSVNNAIIQNNWFNNLTPGIRAGADNFAIRFYFGSSGNNISHNSFLNLQGGGIDIETGPSDPAISNNIMDRNYMNHINTSLDMTGDIGALYIDDNEHTGTGNTMTNNVIYDNCSTNYAALNCKAIYLDDNTSNMTVTGNICQHCGTWAFQIHGGNNNVFQNNIFDISTASTQMALYQQTGTMLPMTGNVFQNNLVYTSGSASGITLWNNQKGTGANPTVSTNLYFAVGGGSWVNTNPVDGNRILADPLFVNPSIQNFTMPDNSPAFTMAGFVALPTNQGPM